MGTHDNAQLNTPPIAPVVVDAPVRVLGAAFMPDATRPTWCSYVVQLDAALVGADPLAVELYADPKSPGGPTTLRAVVGNQDCILNVRGQLTFLCPAGWEVLLVAVVPVGAAAQLNEQCEVHL